MLGVRARRRQPDDFDRAGRQLEPQLPRRILEHRAQLDELGHERAQAPVGGQPLRGQRDGYARSRRHVRDELVADVHVGVRVIARRGEEPRLHRSPIPDALDAARPLRQPHVAQPAAEQTTTTAGLGQLAKHSQAPLDRIRVHADAVVGAADLEAPARQRRRPQRPHLRAPCGDERRVRRAEAQLDAAVATTAGGDRRVRIRDQLGHDLDEIDPALGEVLPEVPAAYGADADCGMRQHAVRI